MDAADLKMPIRAACVPASMVAVALLTSACVPGGAGGAQSADTRSWEVDFELSGGFAGITKQMRISHDGRLVAENLKRRTRVEKRISPDQLRDLDRMIGQARSRPEAAAGTLGRRCADCIHYRLTVAGVGDRPTLSESGTIEGRGPGEPDLIGFLTAVLNEAVPP